MFFDLFVLWSLSFNIFCSFFFIVLCFESHYESYFWSSLTLVLFVVFISSTSEVLPVFKAWAVSNKWMLGSIVMLYFPIGFLWSIFKWFVYLKDSCKRLSNGHKKGDNKIWSHVSGKNVVEDSLPKYLEALMPTALDSKGKLVSWVAYWPFSFVDFCLSDFFIRIGNLIYDMSANIYNKMRKNIISS